MKNGQFLTGFVLGACIFGGAALVMLVIIFL